nr:apolipoprotein N-acyltransferase [Tolumonas osonensis]
MTGTFAPYNWWPLAFIAMTGFLFHLQNQTPWRAFRLCWLFAMGMNITGLSWIHVSMSTFSGMSLAAAYSLVAVLCAYLSLYPAMVGYLLNRFFPTGNASRLLLAFPALWLMSDWMFGQALTGFPWMWIGYSQTDTWLAGYAPLFGVQSVTLAVVCTSAALVLAITQRKIRWLFIPVMLFIGGYGLQRQEWTTPGEEVDFALIQGNIPQSLKWEPSEIRPTLLKYLTLTQKNMDADIVAWPESAVPAMENDMREFMTNMDETLRSKNTGFITGIQYYDQQNNQSYNAVVGIGLIDKEGQQSYQYGRNNRWYKQHLVPIGEFVPFETYLRPLAPIFNLPMSSFSRGNAKQANILVKGYKFATAICYETEFSDEMRQNIHDDTQFIMNVSNDSWFGESTGPWQHLNIARMRAIEFGKPLLRPTNSGVTAAFDEKGRLLASLPQFEMAALRVKVKTTTGTTPYTKWGSIPLVIYVVSSLLLAYRLQVVSIAGISVR